MWLYFLEEINIIYHDPYKDCIPINCNLIIYDNKKILLKLLISTIELKTNLIYIWIKKIEVNEIARIISFTFKGNLGGDYIIIKKIKFKGEILDDFNYLEL